VESLAAIAFSISPVISVIAVRNKLPKLCPLNPSPAWKRYWNSSVNSFSSSAKAATQLRISPGGNTPISRRSRPLALAFLGCGGGGGAG